MKDDIEKIITDGIYAPSGENCQPWRFVVKGNVIEVFNLPELDKSLYNYKQKGSYVAHGALIENIVISASRRGYSSSVQIFPRAEENLISAITLTKAEAKNEPLFPFVVKRHTNRKDHKQKKLNTEQKNALTSAAKEGKLGELTIIDDKVSMDKLGKALAVNEQVIFENKKLHDFFYEHILWKEDDQYKAGGFYIKTLEFLPHQLKGVKLFKAWPILKLLNKIGKVSRVIAKENSEKYAKSGALGIITVNGNANKDYVNAGRVAERVWLTATKLGISVHPCTGVLYFMENIRDHNEKEFSLEHQDAIRRAYADIIKTFKVSGKTTPMLFRLGFAEEASAKAMRMNPEIKYLT